MMFYGNVALSFSSASANIQSLTSSPVKCVGCIVTATSQPKNNVIVVASPST